MGDATSGGRREFLKAGGLGLLLRMSGGGAARAENRVVLAGEKDAYGIPRARILHRFSPETVKLWQHLLSEGRATVEAAGARLAWTSRSLIAGHIVGGTIMGSDPTRSVTDSYGRLHDVANVVVAGSSLFPASGGTSPTFTLHAVTLRSAERLIKTWGSYARSSA